MSDVEKAFPCLLPDSGEFILHESSGMGIEGGEGFVHQEKQRVVGKGSGNRNSLFHPPREFVGIFIFQSLKAYHMDVFVGDLQLLRLRDRRSSRP